MTPPRPRSFRCAGLAILALAALALPAAAWARLVVMHGYADVTSAMLWVQADAPGPVEVSWR
ncbi:MAG TPA: hypothetical protein VF196_00320, partial [Casimicrobiaceae bacterium]